MDHKICTIPVTFVRITCEKCGNAQNGAIPGNFSLCLKCGSIMEIRKSDFTVLDKVRDFFGCEIDVIGHSAGQLEGFYPDDKNLPLLLFGK